MTDLPRCCRCLHAMPLIFARRAADAVYGDAAATRDFFFRCRRYFDTSGYAAMMRA